MAQAFSPEMQSYFSSLPSYVQELIKQTAVDITTPEELHGFAENLMRQNGQ